MARASPKRPNPPRALFQPFALAVTPSTFCKARCLHCLYPLEARSRDRYRQDLMHLLARDLPPSIGLISITGGEPFDRPRRLFDLVHRFSAGGRAVIAVTNGLWSRNRDHARRLLTRLAGGGLIGLTLSVDDYHRPSLAAVDIVRLVDLARSLDLMINLQGVGASSLNAVQNLLLRKDPGILWGQYSLERVGMATKLPPDRIEVICGGGCLSAMEPSIDPDGRVLACCSVRNAEVRSGHLLRGKLADQPLGTLLAESGSDFVLAAIALFGPAFLYKMLGDESGVVWANARPCRACIALSNDAQRCSELAIRFDGSREVKKEIAARHLLGRAAYRQGRFGWVPTSDWERFRDGS